MWTSARSHSRKAASVLVMACALLGAGLVGPTALPAQAANPGAVIGVQTATLTQSSGGMPAPGTTPARQIQKATVDITHQGGRALIEVDITLAGAPAPAYVGYLEVGLGRLQGNSCVIGTVTGGPVFIARGQHQKVMEWKPAPSASWNCVVVILMPTAAADPADFYDAKVGRLSNSYHYPKVTLGRPQLLGKGQKNLKLVWGVSQKFQVTVKNSGKAVARNLKLTGKGSGLKVSTISVGTIQPGQSKQVTVSVKLRSKKVKKTKVRFRITGTGVTKSSNVSVKRIKKPKKLADGLYKGNRVRFRVKNGKIRNFYASGIRMRCTPPLAYPTYRNVSLTFPTTKVPKHGYFDGAKRYKAGAAWYNSTFRGRAVGSKVTQGRYTYTTSGSCRVDHAFKAKRAGR